MAQNKKQRLLWGLGLLGTAVFTLLMGWLHYQQLLSTGYYYSDIPAHMAGHAMGNTGFSLVTVLLRGVFAIGGNLGNASPAGDLIPVMYLYDAKVEIASPNGTRIVPVADVILRPGKTILEPNEAFIRFLFAVPAFQSAFVKLGSRKKVTISRIGVALGLEMDGDYVREMKMFAGAISIKPVAFEKAGDFMKGKTINEQNVLDVAQILSDYIAENVAPEFDRDYKVYASRGVVADVFERILGRL